MVSPVYLCLLYKSYNVEFCTPGIIPEPTGCPSSLIRVPTIPIHFFSFLHSFHFLLIISMALSVKKSSESTQVKISPLDISTPIL